MAYTQKATTTGFAQEHLPALCFSSISSIPLPLHISAVSCYPQVSKFLTASACIVISYFTRMGQSLFNCMHCCVGTAPGKTQTVMSEEALAEKYLNRTGETLGAGLYHTPSCSSGTLPRSLLSEANGSR
jgi:hypothetical protein